MQLTLFLDYPSNIVCFDKPGLKELIEDMEASTSLTREQIIEQFADSLGTILIFNQEEGAWDELFEIMEPKQFNKETDRLEAADSLAMTAEQRDDLVAGAHNFAAEMKALYPEIYTETVKLIDSAQRLNAFMTAIIKAQNDPELAELLNSPNEESD
jgi:hypothetical protein